MASRGDGWPAWATERVEVAEPDPGWTALAERLAADLHERLGAWLAGRIEHIGSTAVPGLPAKPVVDLMAPVADLGAAAGADSVLEEAGWHLVPPHLDDRPWRRFYVLPDGAVRVAHLQVVALSSRRWHDTLAFRDALRARPELARAYAAVKHAAAQAQPHDRERYTAAKSEFVREVLAALP